MEFCIYCRGQYEGDFEDHLKKLHSFDSSMAEYLAILEERLVYIEKKMDKLGSK